MKFSSREDRFGID